MPKRRGSIGTAMNTISRADLAPNREATDRQMKAEGRAAIRRAQKQQWISAGRGKPRLPPLLCLTPSQAAFLKDRDARRAARKPT